MKASEFELCRTNGVTDIVEIKIGFDGIVVATARIAARAFNLRLQDLVPGPGQGKVPGRRRRLRRQPGDDVEPDQPRPAGPAHPGLWPAAHLGHPRRLPRTGHGPGRRPAAPALAAIKASDGDRFETLAHTLREDNAWIDSGENDNAIVQTLNRTPGSLGVFGFSFLEQNLDTVKAETIDGVAPSAATIADGTYPLARSLYIYVKKQHVGVTPGLEAFVLEFMSDASAGRGGYLQDRGLVPLPADQLEAVRTAFRARTAMVRPG
jgi:phosphate transport system substrate-binding protein